MSLSVHDEIYWQVWLVTERDARRSALPLSWAVLIYGDLAYPWRLYFWHDWEGEPKPDGWFSSFWHGWEDEPLPDGWFSSPDSRPPPDNWQADYDYDEVEAAERCGRLRLIDKLITGELQTTGFEPGAPLDSPPTPIHPARWRLLVPDFETSSATGPDGVEVVGIRILPRQDVPASTEPPAATDLLKSAAKMPGSRRRTGPPPTLRDRVVAEMLNAPGGIVPLMAMKEVELELKYDVSRDTARKARKEAVARLTQQEQTSTQPRQNSDQRRPVDH